MTAACLVLLVLNDHMLKTAWPGVVTGKLSDLTGLVVAPPLLAVGLAAARVPRPAVVALVATAVGYALTKSTDTGAEVASRAWSLVVDPTYIRADRTDLLALPAILVAAQVRRTARIDRGTVRRRAAVAAGAALLPFALLATAATSPCSQPDGFTAVGLVAGDFYGPPRGEQTRIVVGDGYSSSYFVGPGTDRVRLVGPLDEARISDRGPYLDEACDPERRLACWRVGEGERPAVDVTRDGGATWQRDYEMATSEAGTLHEDLGESCDQQQPIHVRDIAVLDTADGPVVAAAASNAGLLLRSPDGSWSRWDRARLADEAARSVQPLPGDRITPVEPDPFDPLSSQTMPTQQVTPCTPNTCAYESP